MKEELIFQSRSERIAGLVGTQLYDAGTDTYYAVTRVACTEGVWSLYGVPVEIPELTYETE